MIFIYKIWFMYNDMMGMGEKPPKKYIYKKNKEKFLVWFPFHPPVYKIGGRLFSGSKEAGPTLGGAGILIYRDYLFHCTITMKARGLEFLGEGEGSGLSLTMLSMRT